MEWFDAEHEDDHYFGILDSLIDEIGAGNNDCMQTRYRFGNLIKLVDSEGSTLLHYNAEGGDAFLTKWLIDYGLDVNAQNKYGESALMIALRLNHEDVIKVLLKCNAQIHLMDNYGQTVLNKVSVGLLTDSIIPGALLLKLLENCRSEKEAALRLYNIRCPLNVAMLMKSSFITEFLLKLGVKDLDHEEPPALHISVYFHDLKSVQLLLQYGHDVNSKDAFGRTPMMYIKTSQYCKDHQQAILKLLLNRGAHLTTKHTEWDRYIQLYSIFCYCNRDTIRLILEANVDFRMKDGLGNTPLHFLASNKDPGILRLLQNQILDVNARNNENSTALEYAIGNPKILRFLLDHQTDVNNQNIHGYTPLFYALCCKSQNIQNLQCVEMLLQYGAEVQVVTSKNYTVFDMVIHYETYDLAKPVLAHLARLEANGTIIKNEIRSRIKSDDQLEKYFNLYKHQLEQLKKTIIFDSVTMFKLLTESEEKLLIYLRNRQLASNLKNLDYKNNRATYYHKELHQRVQRGFQKLQVIKRAAATLGVATQISYNSYPIIIEQIFSYLSNKDLINLGLFRMKKIKL